MKQRNIDTHIGILNQGAIMFDDLKELEHYFVELSKIHNEAMFLLKEAAIEIKSQSLKHRIDTFLDALECSRRGAQ